MDNNKTQRKAPVEGIMTTFTIDISFADKKICTST